MTAKEELEKVKILAKTVERKLLDIEAIQTMLSRATGCLTGVIVQGGEKSNFSDSLDRLMEAQRAANSVIDSFVDYKTYVTEKIDRISDPLLAEILYDRYIRCKDMKDLAIQLQYHENYIYKLHDKALEAYAEVGESGEKKITKVKINDL